MASAGNGYSFISPVVGSMRPIRLPHWPAHQMVPSGASTGSRARWPSVGTFHSVNPTSRSPGTSVGARVVSGGMLAARYWAISDRSFAMSAKSTMLEKCSAHSSSV